MQGYRMFLVCVMTVSMWAAGASGDGLSVLSGEAAHEQVEEMEGVVLVDLFAEW